MVKIRHTIFYRHFLVARSKFRDPRNTKQKFSLRTFSAIVGRLTNNGFKGLLSLAFNRSYTLKP